MQLFFIVLNYFQLCIELRAISFKMIIFANDKCFYSDHCMKVNGCIEKGVPVHKAQILKKQELNNQERFCLHRCVLCTVSFQYHLYRVGPQTHVCQMSSVFACLPIRDQGDFSMHEPVPKNSYTLSPALDAFTGSTCHLRQGHEQQKQEKSHYNWIAYIYANLSRKYSFMPNILRNQ